MTLPFASGACSGGLLGVDEVVIEQLGSSVAGFSCHLPEKMVAGGGACRTLRATEEEVEEHPAFWLECLLCVVE